MPVSARYRPPKGGQERYGLAPDTQAQFEHCLSESTQPDLPLPSRTARAYLDILFFHPLQDGNARTAMSASAIVLARKGPLLDQVHPLQTTRWADDAEGAAGLAVLLVSPDHRCGAASDPREADMNERDVLLNELAQGPRPMSQGIEWFDSLGQEEQSEVLLFLRHHCAQAPAVAEDAPESIRRAGLRPSVTPIPLPAPRARR
ncbi:DUF5958 family protein, partial [Streptomyces albogriseolus]|uniref:DUF5958 family protein n=1 Tax=Streptomyces albogriseolus TaxID=1887 RepID=UPI0034603CEE